MKRLITVCVFLLAGSAVLAFQPGFEVKAGGILLQLPNPSPDLRECGDKLRTTVFELMVPSTNRLLTAFVPSKLLEDSRNGKPIGAVDLYAMLEVPRQLEYTDVTPASFSQMKTEIETTLGSVDPKIVGRAEEEMNLRLNAIDVNRIQIGKPEMLGRIFQRPDASGYAMLISLKQGERTVTMATGVSYIRVKNRLVYAYLYRRYESPDTVRWIRANLESWTDAIMSKNKL